MLEIAGCFAFWSWLKLGKSAFVADPGMVALAGFAYLLTLADAELRAAPMRLTGISPLP